MQLKEVDRVTGIGREEFLEKYLRQDRPVVIPDLAHAWPASQRWDWDFFKSLVGNVRVGVYNNVKSDAYTPINTADDYMLFGEYLDLIRRGPAGLRIFLFNIFDHAPQITQDFEWPEHLMKGFVKRYPMLFVGGEGSVTHMHFDIDLSHIFHTQFAGSKRILLFPYREQDKLYRKPWEVLSLVNFEGYADPQKSRLETERFPALELARGYEVVLNHGETLFMPAGYWHHMEYLESGFALSLRALQTTTTGKLKGVWNLFGMRSIDTLMKRTVPHWWYDYKRQKTYAAAARALREVSHPKA